MSSEPATTAAAARVLAGRIGAHRRARSHRPGVATAAPYRRGTAGRTPPGAAPQRPPARPVATGSVPPTSPVPPGPAAASRLRHAPLHALARLVAHWGAGPDGAHLAWPARAPRAVPRPVSRLRGLTHRLALWGAGPDGEYLAWPSARSGALTAGRTGTSRRAVSSDAPPDADRPVLRHELPGTPTIQPAASSPAAALLPSGPASSAGPREARPVPSGAVPVRGVGPAGRPERSVATGWPAPPRPTSWAPRHSPAATGPVRARGDPLTCPVRGSPPPARRARSPGSDRSPFPHGPAHRSGTGRSHA
jgi:hypothetical protein